MSRCLLVHAHPLGNSLTRLFLDKACEALAAEGHDLELLDLYPANFDPRLTPAERASYYSQTYDRAGIDAESAQLERAEILVLVFPTWWFGLPAILKGWVDRVFSPGTAFDHTPDFGPISPRLTGLRHVIAVTTLGSPWWVDWLVMRRPVRRMLKTALIGACAPNARFRYLPFYAAERPTQARIERYSRRLIAALAKL